MPISVGKDCGDMSGRTRVGGGGVSGEFCVVVAYQKWVVAFAVEIRIRISTVLVSSHARK